MYFTAHTDNSNITRVKAIKKGVTVSSGVLWDGIAELCRMHYSHYRFLRKGVDYHIVKKNTGIFGVLPSENTLGKKKVIILSNEKAQAILANAELR